MDRKQLSPSVAESAATHEKDAKERHGIYPHVTSKSVRIKHIKDVYVSSYLDEANETQSKKNLLEGCRTLRLKIECPFLNFMFDLHKATRQECRD